MGGGVARSFFSPRGPGGGGGTYAGFLQPEPRASKYGRCSTPTFEISARWLLAVSRYSLVLKPLGVPRGA